MEWHDRPAVGIENRFAQIVVVPALGARVVSLVDRRTNREWLVQAEPADVATDEPGWAADDAVFGGREAFGWDECVPTVASCVDPLDPSRPALRDHGDQWGRPADVDADVATIRASWTSLRWPYVLRRTLTLDGPGVVAAYELEIGGEQPMPILWSMHALLALEPGARLLVRPTGSARITHHTGFGIPPGTTRVGWPGSGASRFDEVRDSHAGQAAKLYFDARPLTTVAARGVDGSELRFDWDRTVAPTLGIWLDHGGWPAGERRRQVALEPTTSPDDDLESAIAAGRAMVVAPGKRLRWTVWLELVAGR